MSELPAWLFVLHWSLEHVGGVNQVVLNLARALQAEGRFRPIVLTADWPSPEPVWGEYRGISTVRWRLRPPKGHVSGGVAIVDKWRCAAFGRRFRAFCTDHRVAVVNSHYLGDATQAVAGALVDCRPPLPLIVSVHGTDVNTCANQTPGVRLRTETMLSNCTALVAPSTDLAARCAQLWRSLPKPQVIANGLDSNAFRHLAAASPAAMSAAPTVLSIGKFETQKGQDLLVDAFAQLAPVHPELRLCLIGARAEQLSRLQQMAVQHGLSSRIQFYVDMPHSQVAGLLKTATVLVLPSRQEAFGIVLLEAGSLGVPVIATRVGGVPEVIGDESCGLMVPPDDVHALVSAIQKTLNDPVSAAARAERFRVRVDTHFTWTRACHDYLGLLAPRPIR